MSNFGGGAEQQVLEPPLGKSDTFVISRMNSSNFEWENVRWKFREQIEI